MKFKRLKIPSDEAIPYLKNDNELSQYWEQLNQDCYGEIIIDSDTLDHIGHVFVWHTKKNKGFIFNLEVKPQYRRQGYGWILLDDAVKKYDGIDLLVDEDNIPAIKLYEKYGFETIKTVNGQLWMKLNQIKQEGVIMFFDRLGNSVTGEPKIVEEPVVESYYDPNKPIRPGFEKPEMFQEGLFDVFKPKPSKTQKSSSSPKTIEDVETMHDIVIDKAFKKFITENPNGGKFKYPNNKIVSKEILEFIDDEGDPSICSLNQFIDANCEYDGCIDTHDHCLYIGGWIDDKALYLATNKSSCAPEGSIIFSDVIENGYDYNDRIFAKSFKELLKNATFGKDIKEYSEMDLDEMSDYISEYVLNNNNEEFIEESTSRSLKEVKKHNKDVERNKNIAEKTKTKQSFRNKNLISTDGNQISIIIRDNDSDEVKEQKRYIISQLIKYRNILESDEKSNHANSIKKKLCRLLGHPEWINRTFHAFNYDDEHMSFFISDSEMHNLLQHPEEYRFIRFSHTERPNGGVVRPSHISRSEKSKYMYGTNRVYFYAVKPSGLWLFGIKGGGGSAFGKFVEEYKPKRGDKFYIDNTMVGNTSDRMAVFINTSIPLKVVPFSTKDPEYIKSAKDFFGQSYNETFTDEEYDVFVEAKISTAERNELNDDDFGLVYTDEDGKKVRKYPLTDKQHVLQAVRFFGDCPDKHKPKLARNILEKANKFGMDTSNWEKIHEWTKKSQSSKVNEYYIEYDRGKIETKSVKCDIENLVKKSIIKKLKTDEHKKDSNSSKAISLEDFEKVIGVELTHEMRDFIKNQCDGTKNNYKYLDFDIWYTDFWESDYIYTNYTWSSEKYEYVTTRTKDLLLNLRKGLKLSDPAKRILGEDGVNTLIPIGGLCLGFKECDDQIIFLHPKSGLLFSNIFMKTYQSKNEIGPICLFKDFEKYFCESYVNGQYVVKIDSIMKCSNFGTYGYKNYSYPLDAKELIIKSESGNHIRLSTLSRWWTIVQCEEYDCCPTTWLIDQYGSWMFNYLKQNEVINQSDIDKLKSKFPKLDNLDNGEWASVFNELTNGNITITLLDGYESLTKYFGYMTMKINNKYFFVLMKNGSMCAVAWSTNSDPSRYIFN